MREILLNILDQLSIQFRGHSYRWLRWQREWLREMAIDNEGS